MTFQPKIRGLLSLIITALIVSGFWLFSANTQKQVVAQATPSPETRRSVSVTGSGSVRATPDFAVVTIGVQTQDTTASKALTTNSQQMEKLLASLRSAGVANADLKTQGIQLYPQAEPQPTPLPNQQSPTATVPGYTAVNTVEVTVRDLDKLGPLLDQSVTAGGNLIQNVRFDVSTPNASLDQAREAAFNDANRKASQLATLAGLKLGPVITIVETSFLPAPAVDVGSVRMEQAQSAVPVSPGTQIYTVDIQVTFELQ